MKTNNTEVTYTITLTQKQINTLKHAFTYAFIRAENMRTIAEYNGDPKEMERVTELIDKFDLVDDEIRRQYTEQYKKLLAD